MGRPACLHPDVFLSVECLLQAAHPAFFLFIKTSNVIIFFIKKKELRNKNLGCISVHPSIYFDDLCLCGACGRMQTLFGGYSNMNIAMEFLWTFIPPPLAEHGSDWCCNYSCQMSHGGNQAFAPLSWWLWGVILGRSCRINTIDFASVSEWDLLFRTFWAIVITKAVPSLLIFICLDLDLSPNFSTLVFLMNLLWAKAKKLETGRTWLLSKWFWVQPHSHRISCENNVSCWKKGFFSSFLSNCN